MKQNWLAYIDRNRLKYVLTGITIGIMGIAFNELILPDYLSQSTAPYVVAGTTIVSGLVGFKMGGLEQQLENQSSSREL